MLQPVSEFPVSKAMSIPARTATPMQPVSEVPVSKAMAIPTMADTQRQPSWSGWPAQLSRREKEQPPWTPERTTTMDGKGKDVDGEDNTGKDVYKKRHKDDNGKDVDGEGDTGKDAKLARKLAKVSTWIFV